MEKANAYDVLSIISLFVCMAIGSLTHKNEINTFAFISAIYFKVCAIRYAQDK